ncbi:hypothetical protein [Natronoglycomyces albus]|uniref:Uncharacterized protein n=1 Tax=Natronoglycomyces albus TaxID=2811108 RepID=A0A895XRW8_9ACTN|nr:hypothetical protein [Natronoglycomyces albus]QSB05306.1 hypothetical protein JQS30_16410 [Natronoglycomyces albus]
MRRKHRRRTRLAAGFTASLVAMGGAAGMSFAMADSTPESGGSEIIFSGSCGLLSTIGPNSSPNVDDLSVPAGTVVSFTNDTGRAADLLVGNSSHDIDRNATMTFTMNQSAEVAMVPQCGLILPKYDTAMVTVSHDDSSSDSSSSGSGSSSSGSTAPQASSHDLPSTQREDSDEGASTESSGGGVPSGESGHPQGGPAGTPGGEVEAADDADSDVGDSDESSLPFPPVDRDSTEDESDGIATAGEVQAVDREQLKDGASGLLALLAIVCLVGVGAAALRTMMAQRATAA